MISGLKVTAKKRVQSDQGGIYAMLRSDDPDFVHFGEVYFSRVAPGIVRGWYLHTRSILNYMLLQGELLLKVIDDRPSSASKGGVQEIRLKALDGTLVQIPTEVWYSFESCGEESALIANCSTHPHDELEMKRLPLLDPYMASIHKLSKPGLHG